MGERVMADVMQQRRELDLQLLGDTTGKMVRTERVLKPGVRGARVHEKRVTELPDVPQTLERRRIDDGERLGLEANVVPERVANYFKRRRTAQNSFGRARGAAWPVHRRPSCLSTWTADRGARPARQGCAAARPTRTPVPVA